MSHAMIRSAGILLAGLLGWMVVGCAAAPDTPFGRGVQDDPAKEINRLSYLINHGHYKGEKAYLAGVQIEDLRRISDPASFPPLNTYGRLIQQYPDRDEAPVSCAKAIIDYQEHVGDWFYSTEAGDRAIGWLGPVIQRNPNNGEYYLLRAQLGKVTLSSTPRVADLRRAEQLLPGDGRVQLELAQVAISERDYDLALRRLLAAQKAMPPSPRVHYLLGMIAGKGGNADEAARQYDLSLSIDPGYVDALAARTLIRWAKADPGLDAYISQVSDLSPAHPSLEFYRGMRMYNSGRYMQATRHVQIAAKFDPRNEVYPRMIKHIEETERKQTKQMYDDIARVLLTGIVIGAAADVMLNNPGGSRQAYPSTPTFGDGPDGQRRHAEHMQTILQLQEEEKKQAAERDRIRRENDRMMQMEAERRRRAMEDARRQYR
jgi:tetratricopeptide (TPR) repeat protein